MISVPRYADFPISHIPMQPSMQVAHIPLNGLIESSVRFLVSVAADALRRVKLIGVLPLARSWYRADSLARVGAERTRQLAGVARVEEAHRVVVALQAHSREIDTAVAQRGIRRRALAAQLAHGTDVETRAALAAQLAGHVERPGDAPVEAPAGEADGSRHHLLGTHPHAQPPLDAGLVFRLVPALPHAGGRGQVLDPFGLGRGRDVQLEQQPAGTLHASGVRPDRQPVFCRTGARRLEARPVPAGYLHEAETAGPVRREPFVVTEGGDRYAVEARYVQHAAATLDLNLGPVDRQLRHGRLLSSPARHRVGRPRDTHRT